MGRCPGFLLAASLYLTTTVIIFAVDSASPRADSSIAAALFDVFFFLLLPPLLPYSVSQAAFRLPVQVTEMACVKWLPAISTIQIFIYVCLFSLPYSNQIDGLREMACVKWPPAISPIQIFIYVCLFFKNCTVTETGRLGSNMYQH